MDQAPPDALRALAINPDMTSPLPNCVTIDATLDAYLDNARAGTRGAYPNSSVLTAADGLTIALANLKPATQSASIVGHATEGLIVTGAGQSVGTQDQHISTNNQNIWRPVLAPLNGKITGLFLYGCHIGANDVGAQLLYDLAQIVGAPVYGPTGLIYCDANGNFRLEAEAQWQVATPEAKPQPIAPPHFPSPLSADVHLHLLNNVVRTTLEQVSAAAYSPNPAVAQPDGAVDPGDLAQEVHWTMPFTPPGQHGAVPTGQLNLSFGFGQRAIQKQFVVYNHTLVQDEDNPGVYYRTSADFRRIAAT